MRVFHASISVLLSSFLSNGASSTAIYTLSLHDALPILSFAVATKFGFLSAVQKQLSVAVSGSFASDLTLQRLFTSNMFNLPAWATLPMLTAVLLIAVLLSVTVQPKSAVPPVFWATYCTVSASAASLVPFTVDARELRPFPTRRSSDLTKPTSTNGPAPHFTC